MKIQKALDELYIDSDYTRLHQPFCITSSQLLAHDYLGYLNFDKIKWINPSPLNKTVEKNYISEHSS